MPVVEEPNGWVRRVQGLAEVLGTPQGILAIFFLLFIGWASGKLPFVPFDRLTDVSREHNIAMLASIDDRRDEAANITRVLERLSTAIDRMDLRAKLIDCDRLKALDLRERCLR